MATGQTTDPARADSAPAREQRVAESAEAKLARAREAAVAAQAAADTRAAQLEQLEQAQDEAREARRLKRETHFLETGEARLEACRQEIAAARERLVQAIATDPVWAAFIDLGAREYDLASTATMWNQARANRGLGYGLMEGDVSLGMHMSDVLGQLLQSATDTAGRSFREQLNRWLKVGDVEDPQTEAGR